MLIIKTTNDVVNIKTYTLYLLFGIFHYFFVYYHIYCLNNSINSFDLNRKVLVSICAINIEKSYYLDGANVIVLDAYK